MQNPLERRRFAALPAPPLVSLYEAKALPVFLACNISEDTDHIEPDRPTGRAKTGVLPTFVCIT